MKNSQSQDQKIAQLSFTKVYPLYLVKVEKKGRTKEELDLVILWLTGITQKKLESWIQKEISFENFFEQVRLNPKAHLIKGVICGIRVEEIQNPLTQKVRYLDKIVDELAKGHSLEKIFRESLGKK